MSITLFLSIFACSDSTAKSSAEVVGENSAVTAESPKNNTPEKIKEDNKVKDDKVMVKGKKGLPDLRVGLNKSGCDNGPGNYGASSYFIGEFSVSNNQVSGTEKWLLFPNKKLAPKWSAQGINGGCEVTWNLTGTASGSTYNLVNELIDTTCPKEIVNKYQDTDQRISYRVTKNSNGTAVFSYLKNGKLLGEGHHSGNQIQYLSNHSCRWF